MNALLRRLFEALGLLAVRKIEDVANAPPKRVKLPPPISDREWGEDKPTPADSPRAKRRGR